MLGTIKEAVSNCPVCKRYTRIPPEPLKPTATPERPWQVVGSDLFQMDGKRFLLLVDYYSRYPEVAVLSAETSTEVQMKSVFARHGIPETVISDNGPAYASNEFKAFAKAYKFTL